jgi:hypothetical protein
VPSQKPQTIVRSTPEQRQRWQEAASHAGYSLNEWIGAACDARAAEDGGRGVQVVPPSTRVIAPEAKVIAPRGKVSACSRSAFHRKGQYCKTCGETP